jgi:hypothetical protein
LRFAAKTTPLRSFVFTKYPVYISFCRMEKNQLLSLTTADLRRAAEIKEQIDQLTSELGSVLDGGARPDQGTSTTRGGARRMSAEGRARIAAAARARWAKVRAGKSTATKNVATKGRRKMSAAARAKIAAAARARWAKVRAAKG